MMPTTEKKTVLLTGAGGPAIPGMVAILRRWGFRIVAVDMDPRASGFYLADAAYVVPSGVSPYFFSRLKDICVSEEVDAVVSVVDEELVSVLDLESLGIAVIQPRRGFVEMCLDKYECMVRLKAAGINAPDTELMKDCKTPLAFPIFVKPRVGRGSRGCRVIGSSSEMDSFIVGSGYDPEDLIVQRLLEGTEFTVSVIVWRDGEIQDIVPKQIISKVGVTRIAVTRRNERIESLCRDIQKRFKADGPFNVQLILDQNGIPWPFEINPRFSTSTTLTDAAGADELGGLISQAFYGKSSYSFKSWRDGVVLIRYTADQFLDESEFQSKNIKFLRPK